MSYYIGIDIGTSGTRALVIDATGALLGSGTALHTCQSPQPLWSEQSPHEWWEAVKIAVPAAVKASGVNPSEIKGVGLSGQMHGLVLLDQNHEVLRPAILWNDQRTSAECSEITDRAGGRTILLERVSNPAMTGFTAPKILWVRKHEPKCFAKAVKALLPKDFIRFKLTGVFATEVSDASGTLMLDVTQRKWSKELLEQLELDGALLPECFESIVPSAEISVEASDALGGSLKAGTKVVGGAGDCAAGAVGAGIVKSGVANVTHATSGEVFAPADQPRTEPLGRAHTFCHAVPGKWHNMGVTLSAGGSLQWFKNTLCHPENSVANLIGGDVYDLIVQEAETAPAGSGGLCFLPYLTGERTPHADPYATGCYVGITPRTTKAHLARATLEGVCYSLRECIEIFRSLNVPVKEARVTGGGAKHAFWIQTLADMFGQSTCTLVASEGAAYGVALLAAVGTGAFNSVEEACEATVKTKGTTEPNPVNVAAYSKYFPIWKDLYGALKNSYKRLARA